MDQEQTQRDVPSSQSTNQDEGEHSSAQQQTTQQQPSDGQRCVAFVRSYADHVAQWAGEAEKALAWLRRVQDLDSVPSFDVVECLKDCARASAKLDRVMVIVGGERNRQLLALQKVLADERREIQSDLDLVSNQLASVQRQVTQQDIETFATMLETHERVQVQLRDRRLAYLSSDLQILRVERERFERYLEETQDGDNSSTSVLVPDSQEGETGESNKENQEPTHDTLERTGAMRRERD